MGPSPRPGPHTVRNTLIDLPDSSSSASSATRRDTATGPVLYVVDELDYVQDGVLRHEVDRLDVEPGQRPVIDLSGLPCCDSVDTRSGADST